MICVVKLPLLTGEVLIAKSHVLETETVIGRARPADLHAVFGSVGIRSRRYESFDVFQRQAERPHRRRVRPRVVHVPEVILTRARPYRFRTYRTVQSERVGGHPDVDAAWIMADNADQRR